MNKKPVWWFAIALLCLSGRLSAHDYWLQANPQVAEQARQVEIDIHVGVDMRGELLPNIPAWYESFNYYDGKKLRDVEGEIGRDPAGYFRPDHPGGYLIGMLTLSNSVELAAPKFHDYLKMEGLEKIIDWREQNGAAEQAGRELYRRCAKNLVQIGDPDSNAAWQYRFGYPLEISPLSNPAHLQVGDSLSIVIESQQKPLANALVVARSYDHPEQIQEVRSDAEGKATFTFPNNGYWLIKAVDMVAVDDDPKFDWQSYWASFGFGIR